MPPTAIEIKARLDKAIDQEGNVLDMDAVLEIVASLEKIVMTKEALEATRIGKTINLMRKKTSNEDLSKRAKKLVKRWQTLVSNSLKKSIKSENLNGVVKRKELEQAGSLNGSKTETQYHSSNEFESKLGTKRKRSSPDNCSVNAKSTYKPELSPRLISSPKPIFSPKLAISHKQGVSPKLGVSVKPEVSLSSRLLSSPRLVSSPKPTYSPKLSVSHNQGISPKTDLSLNTGVSPKRVAPKLGISPGQTSIQLGTSELDSVSATRVISPQSVVSSKLGISPKLQCSSKPRGSPEVILKTDYSESKDLGGGENTKHVTELKSNDCLNHLHENSNEPELEDLRNQSLISSNKCCDNTNNSPGTDSKVTNSTDTRIQENRIVLSDFISTNNSASKSIDIASNETSIHSKNVECIPKEFAQIDSEDLAIVRKELPEDIVVPQHEADGVNGVYNQNDSWRPWTENVEQRDNELLLLPYVLLD